MSCQVIWTMTLSGLTATRELHRMLVKSRDEPPLPLSARLDRNPAISFLHPQEGRGFRAGRSSGLRLGRDV
jgi:hypothetical protein